MKNQLECELRRTLDKVSFKIRRAYDESLRELDLYVGQDNLLARLWEEDGVTAMQLREHLKCEAPTVTNMVKSLEQNGFVTRKKDQNDGRVVRIYLTQAGRELENPIEEKWEMHQNKLFQDISEDEKIMLLELMQRIEKNLSL